MQKISWDHIINTNVAFGILIAISAMIALAFWSAQDLDEMNFTSTSINASSAQALEEMDEDEHRRR